MSKQYLSRRWGERGCNRSSPCLGGGGGSPIQSWPSSGYPIQDRGGTLILFWGTLPPTTRKDTRPVTGVPPGKDMGPMEVLWDGDGVTPCLERTWDQWNYYRMVMGLTPPPGCGLTHKLKIFPSPFLRNVCTNYLFNQRSDRYHEDKWKLVKQSFSEYLVYFQAGMSESGYGGSMELAI